MSLKVLNKSKRRQKIRLSIKFFLLFFFLFSFLIGSSWALEFAFKPRGVILDGVETLPKEDLLSVINSSLQKKFLLALPAGNLIILSKKNLSKTLKENFQRINEVSVKKNYFKKTLKVVITERAPWAVWCQKKEGENVDTVFPKECYYADKNGALFQNSPIFSGGLILQILDKRDFAPSLGKTFLDKISLEGLQNFLDLFVDSGYPEVAAIEITKDSAFWINTVRGWKVFIDNETDPKIALENLGLLINSTLSDNMDDLDYIDLRFSNKSFYKLK